MSPDIKHISPFHLFKKQLREFFTTNYFYFVQDYVNLKNVHCRGADILHLFDVPYIMY